MRQEASCSVGSAIEALRDQAKRTHFEGTDVKVFQAYQNLFEQVASDAFDAATINEAGCVIVTKEALDRLSRAGPGRRRVQGAGAIVQAPQTPFGRAILRVANLTEKRRGSREG